MATIYTLKFEQFKVQNEYDDGTNPVMNNVIRDLHWRLDAVTDDATPITASVYGTERLALPTYGSFIARESVTLNDVHGWFSSLLTDGGANLLQSLKSHLDTAIAKKTAPTEVLDEPASEFKDGLTV